MLSTASSCSLHRSNPIAGVHSPGATHAERAAATAERRRRYQALRAQWRSVGADQAVLCSKWRERRGRIDKDVRRTGERWMGVFRVGGSERLEHTSLLPKPTCLPLPPLLQSPRPRPPLLRQRALARHASPRAADLRWAGLRLIRQLLLAARLQLAAAAAAQRLSACRRTRPNPATCLPPTCRALQPGPGVRAGHERPRGAPPVSPLLCSCVPGLPLPHAVTVHALTVPRCRGPLAHRSYVMRGAAPASGSAPLSAAQALSVEADAFWAFRALMDRMAPNFSSDSR